MTLDPPTTFIATARSRYAFRSDTGRRRERNEDAVAVIAPGPGDRWGFDLAAVVCDGVGGQPRGDMASTIAVEMLVRALSREDRASLGTRLRSAAEAANAAIREFASRAADGAPLASTLVAVALREGAAIVAHIGDSRAYRFRRGALEALTQDHSIVQEQVRQGLLPATEAKRHPLRSRLSRALGSEERVVVDIAEHHVEPDDLILVCSDGLHAFVEEADIAAALSDDLEGAVRKLVDLANEAGGTDNCTVALMRQR